MIHQLTLERSFRVAGAVWAVLWMISCAGCGTQTKPAAASSTVTVDDRTEYVGTLTPTQRTALVSAFQSLTEQDQASTLPEPAALPEGRWSDVYSAVLFACDDVEMAVVYKRQHEWGWEFRLRSVEDWPAILIVQSTEGHDSILDDGTWVPMNAVRRETPVYRAAATVGMFHDRTQRAEALLEALDRHMRAFGTKRRMPD